MTIHLTQGYKDDFYFRIALVTKGESPWDEL